MSYVILVRNPKNKKLFAVTDGEDTGSFEYCAEFGTEQEATDAAHDTTICKAWGYEVVEVANG
jgi:hypothetical protein